VNGFAEVVLAKYVKHPNNEPRNQEKEIVEWKNNGIEYELDIINLLSFNA
jgi:hypothetical protein